MILGSLTLKSFGQSWGLIRKYTLPGPILWLGSESVNKVVPVFYKEPQVILKHSEVSECLPEEIQAAVMSSIVAP